MNKVENYYQEMLEMLQDSINDVEKFAEGNKSAGTRIRKTMQNVKNLAQAIRVEVQEQKNAVAV